jgi:DNA-binding CsgD family transcriptional regulator
MSGRDDLYGNRVPTAKQWRIIELVAQGLTNRHVARKVGSTEYVIKNHLREIYDKLGLWNRVELALWYEARRHEGRPSAPATRAHSVSVAQTAVHDQLAGPVLARLLNYMVE